MLPGKRMYSYNSYDTGIEGHRAVTDMWHISRINRGRMTHEKVGQAIVDDDLVLQDK
jgi:hypothetical protein